MNNNSLTQSQFWSPCNITASHILCNWQTDRQTDRQTAPCSIWSSCAGWVRQWLDRLVCCWRSQHSRRYRHSPQCHHPTTQTHRHTHAAVHTMQTHTHTHADIHTTHTHTHTQTSVCRYWKQTCTENYNKYNKWHKAGWCGTSVSLWDTTAHLNPHRQLPRLSPYHPATARVHNSESREVNTS